MLWQGKKRRRRVYGYMYLVTPLSHFYLCIHESIGKELGKVSIYVCIDMMGVWVLGYIWMYCVHVCTCVCNSSLSLSYLSIHGAIGKVDSGPRQIQFRHPRTNRLDPLHGHRRLQQQQQ